MSLLLCNTCMRHYLSTESHCPHCTNSTTIRTKNPSLISAVLLGISLSACGGKEQDTADTGSQDTGSQDTGIQDTADQPMYGVPDTATDTDDSGTDTGTDTSDSGQDTGIQDTADQPMYGIPDTGFGPEYGVEMVDDDGDGWDAELDCDDNDANTHPGTAEHDSATECMKDSDNDGYGDANATSPIVAGTDCNDDDPSVNPGASDPSKDCSE